MESSIKHRGIQQPLYHYMQNCPRHRSLRLCKNNPRIPFLLRRGPRRHIRRRRRRYGRRRRRRVALKRRASCRDSVSCLLRLAVAWSLGQCERAVVRRPWLAYWEAPQRKIRLGSLCGDVRWAHAGADCRAALLQRARGKRIERAGEEEGRAREDCARTREAGRARGSRDAEWSSLGINAEGAPRF